MIPEWLKFKKGENEKNPVWFLDLRGTSFDPKKPDWQNKVNKELKKILKETGFSDLEQPALLKTHIGENKCDTHLLPEYCRSTVDFLREEGINNIAFGDSTVAYTGDRGHKENTTDCDRYYSLARNHGWTKEGPLGIPFVVLDRPYTSVPGGFEFSEEEKEISPKTTDKFNKVYITGGFDAAGTIVNHIHLTLHGLAQVAGAVKGLTMGCSSYRGKFTMHKSYYPVINQDICMKCGICANKCPENALKWEKGDIPKLDTSKCIGCGECVAVCPNKSITMASHEINDWAKGSESLPYRMIDYLMGMMEGKWDKVVNIMHLYNITELCDCVEQKQEPFVEHIGFLISKNPFALDLAANRLLQKSLHKKIQSAEKSPDKDLPEQEVLKTFFKDFHREEPYEYVNKTYNAVCEPELIRFSPE